MTPKELDPSVVIEALDGDGFDRVLYASLVDVSLPYGPGVNERGFLRDMAARSGIELLAVIPRPCRQMPGELLDLDTVFLPRGRSIRTVPGWCQANAVGTVALVRAAKQFAPDLVIMRAGALPLPQFVLSQTLRIPYVLKTAGDVSFQRFYERGVIPRSMKRLNQLMFGKLLRGSACVDVVSVAQQVAAIELYPDLEARVHVVDNGVDLVHFVPRQSAEARQRMGFSTSDCVIGYVGGLPMQRGGKEVIDVVANSEDGGVRGLIVGDGGEARACVEYARLSGVSDSVVVLGEADYGDVPELMACTDIGLSIRRPRERGQSEMKVRQYLATGLCVVGTAVSNDFLRGRSFARVVETDDTSEVVTAVRSFIQLGREGIRELGKQARTFAESSLSIEARNDQRLRLWAASVRERANG